MNMVGGIDLMSVTTALQYSYPSLEAWQADIIRRFGLDPFRWRFRCPSCGHVASVQDWKNAGTTEEQMAFSCIGLLLPDPKPMLTRPGPCNYAGEGLFRLNPVSIVGFTGRLFAFADPAIPVDPEIAS